MAKVTQHSCDRCGRSIEGSGATLEVMAVEPDEHGELLSYMGRGFKTIRMELCASCGDSLRALLRANVFTS